MTAKGGYVRYHPYAHYALPPVTLRRDPRCDKSHTAGGALSSHLSPYEAALEEPLGLVGLFGRGHDLGHEVHARLLALLRRDGGGRARERVVAAT